MPTTVTKTIGSAGGRDYSTTQSWHDAGPNCVTADQIWRGECYKDSTFSSGGLIVTLNADGTRYPALAAASGQSIFDQSDIRTVALTYDTSRGVAFEYGSQINWASAWGLLDGIQLRVTVYGTPLYPNATGGLYCYRVIIQNGISSRDTDFYFDNCLILNAGGNYNRCAFRHCTISGGVLSEYGLMQLIDTLYIGGSAPNTLRAGSDYNATDLSGLTGSNNVLNLTGSNEVENTSNDFRAKSGNHLQAGISFLTYDATGYTRANPPTIGFYEYAASGPTVIVASESDRLGLSDAAFTRVLIPTAETVRVGETENIFPRVRVTPTDSLRMGVSEACALISRVAVSESIRSGLSETTATRALFAAVDTLRAAAIEQAFPLIYIRASESLRVAETEAIAVRVLLAVADSLRISLTEASALLVRVAVSESNRSGLTDATALLVLARVADTLRVGDTEQAFPLIYIRASESMRIGEAETSALRVLVAVSEALRVSLSEALALLVRVRPADTTAIILGERGVVSVQGSGLVTVTVSDSLRVVVAEANVLRAFLTPSESLRVGLGESPAVRVLVAVLDSLCAGLSDAPRVAALVRTSDTLRVAETELARIVVAVTAADAFRLGLTEVSRLLVRLAVSELAVPVRLSESPVGFGRCAAADGVVVAVGEQEALLVRVKALEALGIGTAEIARTVAKVVAQEALVLELAVEGTDLAQTTPTGVPSSDRPGGMNWNTQDYRVGPRIYRIRRRW